MGVHGGISSARYSCPCLVTTVGATITGVAAPEAGIGAAVADAGGGRAAGLVGISFEPPGGFVGGVTGTLARGVCVGESMTCVSTVPSSPQAPASLRVPLPSGKSAAGPVEFVRSAFSLLHRLARGGS